MQLKAEIIAIGTELLLGQIANTNAQFISEQLAGLGVPVYYHSVVGDNPERLTAQLEIAKERSNLIIFTGGLGPTKDDLTKHTIAEFIQRELVIDQQAMESIKQFFELRKVTMTPNNERQALVLADSTIFPNNHGLAPGMACHAEGVHYLLFPGPPKELYPMFRDYAVPYLRALLPDEQIVYSKVLRFCGIGESALESMLQDLIDQQSSPTIAPLAKEGEVTLRLTALAKTVGEAEAVMQPVLTEILKRVGEYVYGWDNDTLEEVVLRQLKQNVKTLAIAESCTGGRITAALTRLSGISEYLLGSAVTYSNASKIKLLGIQPALIEQHGAVSPETAEAMAEHIRQELGADFGLSVTGVAGPSEHEGKPVGLVYIGIAGKAGTMHITCHLGGTREMIQHRAMMLAMYHLLTYMKSQKV